MTRRIVKNMYSMEDEILLPSHPIYPKSTIYRGSFPKGVWEGVQYKYSEILNNDKIRMKTTYCNESYL